MLDLFTWSDQHLRGLRVILSRQFASPATARLAAAAHFAAVRRAASDTDRWTRTDRRTRHRFQYAYTAYAVHVITM